MKRLRNRERVDTFTNDRRSTKKSYGRQIYLAMLAMIALVIGNHLWGDLVIFRADGLIVQDRIDIEAGFVGRLEELPVKIGQRVEKGTVIARLQSIDIVERLAQLSLRVAELTNSQIEDDNRIAVAEQLLPLAAERRSDRQVVLTSLTGLNNKGLVTVEKLKLAMDDLRSAEEIQIRLRASLDQNGNASAARSTAMRHAARAFEDLKAAYGDGVVTAPASGVIGTTLPAPGEVFLTGEPILSIHSGMKYVLAYLPPRYLFAVSPGEEVRLRAGPLAATGHVEEILPVSDALPQEFQRRFQPTERGQLARIKLTGAQDWPLNAKVEVRRTGMLWFAGRGTKP